MLEKRRETGDLGGTMRLGAYQAELAKGSKIADIYGDTRFPSAIATVMNSITSTGSAMPRKG